MGLFRRACGSRLVLAVAAGILCLAQHGAVLAQGAVKSVHGDWQIR